MTAPQTTPTDDQSDRRKWRRHDVSEQPSVVATASGKLYSCRIEDISAGGLRLRFDSSMPAGNVIALDHPLAGTICGVAAWRDEAAMGIEIQLPRGELERILKCISLII